MFPAPQPFQKGCWQQKTENEQYEPVYQKPYCLHGSSHVLGIPDQNHQFGHHGGMPAEHYVPAQHDVGWEQNHEHYSNPWVEQGLPQSGGFDAGAGIHIGHQLYPNFTQREEQQYGREFGDFAPAAIYNHQGVEVYEPGVPLQFCHGLGGSMAKPDNLNQNGVEPTDVEQKC